LFTVPDTFYRTYPALPFDDVERHFETITDPTGKRSTVFKDRLGRVSVVVDNHVDVGLSTWGDSWIGGGSGNTDEDQAVNYIYNGLDNVAKLVVLGTYDTTTYLYEDAYNASLATNVIYPDSSDTTSSGSDQVKKTFFLDGLVKSMTDQRGTVVDYSYTTSGGARVLEWEKVTTVGSGVDDHVRAKKYAYDSLGRLDRLTSYTSYATTTGGTIRNEIH
jgi:hypothetical protein